MADNMNYREARRFMANPHVFMNKQKKETDEDMPAMDNRVFGFIVSVLLNSLTGLDSYSSSQSKIRFALRMYALKTISRFYVLTELIYQYSSFAEKGTGSFSDWTETYKLNFIRVYTALLYATELESFKLLSGAVPTIGFAISGKDTYKDSNGEDSESIEFAFYDWKRFYVWLSIVLGLLT